jgi:K+-sensing histidine kinase KdpD
MMIAVTGLLLYAWHDYNIRCIARTKYYCADNTLTLSSPSASKTFPNQWQYVTGNILLSMPLVIFLSFFIAVTRQHKKFKDNLLEKLEKLRDNPDNCHPCNASTDASEDLQEFDSIIMALQDKNRQLQKAVEEATANLANSEKYRLDFFRNVTHDLKTPITAIKGSSEILLKQKCNNKKCKEYQGIIQRNLKRLTIMIQNILDYSRLQTSSLDMFFEVCDLAEIVEDAMLITIPVAWDNRIDVKYITPDRMFKVRGDCDRLMQAVSNILMHAICTSPPGSDILVDIGESDGRHRVSFRFNDPEMSDEKKKTFFERYLRGEMKEPGREQGLALAIARGIVQLHDGDLDFQPSAHPEVSLAMNLPAIVEQV